jgi:hypothetical protein
VRLKIDVLFLGFVVHAAVPAVRDCQKWCL